MSLCLNKTSIVEPRLKTPESRARFYYTRKKLEKLGYTLGYLPRYRLVDCRNDCVICKLKHTAEIIGELFAESMSFNGIGWFCTLTIEDSYIKNGSVDKSHVTKLRDAFNKHNVRYYLTSEYGSHTDRPHYHAIVFSHYIIGHDSICEFILKYFRLGHIEVDLMNFARIRYTANAHVNKCSHKPYFLDDDVLLPCSDNFIFKSRALGDEYIRKNARKIFSDGFMTFEGINFPLSDTTKKHLYDYLGLNQYEQSLLNDFRNPDWNPVDFYSKLAKKFSYSGELFNEDSVIQDYNILKLSQYIRTAEQALESQYYSKYILKGSVNTSKV